MAATLLSYLLDSLVSQLAHMTTWFMPLHSKEDFQTSSPKLRGSSFTGARSPVATTTPPVASVIERGSGRATASPNPYPPPSVPNAPPAPDRASDYSRPLRHVPCRPARTCVSRTLFRFLPRPSAAVEAVIFQFQVWISYHTLIQRKLNASIRIPNASHCRHGTSTTTKSVTTRQRSTRLSLALHAELSPAISRSWI